MTSELYEDIISLILQFVSSDDSHPGVYKTLAACRQVCRQMAVLANPHFFQDTQLTLRSAFGASRKPPAEATRRLETFCQVLYDNPLVGKLVRRFSIVTYLAPGESVHKWLYDSPHIPMILSKLEHLTHFSLRNCAQPLIWSNFSLDISKAIQDIYKIPTLLSLDLQHILGLPLGWITRCEGLTYLSLDGIGHATQDADILHANIEELRPGRIKEMVISAHIMYPLPAEYHQVYALRFFSTTEKIKIIHDHDGSLNYVLPLVLQGVEKTLKEIELAVYNLAIKDWIWIGGMGNYHLEGLESIKIVHPSYRVDPKTLPEIIPWFLSHPHQPSQTVKTIHIVFIIAELPQTPGWRPYGRAEWTRIDPIVQLLYPSLTTFTLEFEEYFAIRPSRQIVLEHMERMVPGIVENPSITLHVILPSGITFDF
ncbi:hypothetical protein CVT24_000398 [Panaeolus cyanescens]|uniref:F-box domain-containing protein n=1 Tax=Panaeolus cyanescens TaxID=181874 RepID=A0A409YDJ4_9AGAR|nr:hypothetical protein CVT24_000398 [Panaeolus cyanescens]